MSEPFPENVQEAIYRLWDVVAAFSEDINSSDIDGFYGLVREERKQYANLLVDYEIFRFSHDESDKCENCENIDTWIKLGSRGPEAYKMITQDLLKPPEKSQIQKYLKA